MVSLHQLPDRLEQPDPLVVEADESKVVTPAGSREVELVLFLVVEVSCET